MFNTPFWLFFSLYFKEKEKQNSDVIGFVLNLPLVVPSRWLVPRVWPRRATGPIYSSAARPWLSTSDTVTSTWPWQPRASGRLSRASAGSLDGSEQRRSWTLSSKTSALENRWATAKTWRMWISARFSGRVRPRPQGFISWLTGCSMLMLVPISLQLSYSNTHVCQATDALLMTQEALRDVPPLPPLLVVKQPPDFSWALSMTETSIWGFFG